MVVTSVRMLKLYLKNMYVKCKNMQLVLQPTIIFFIDKSLISYSLK